MTWVFRIDIAHSHSSVVAVSEQYFLISLIHREAPPFSDLAWNMLVWFEGFLGAHKEDAEQEAAGKEQAGKDY